MPNSSREPFLVQNSFTTNPFHFCAGDTWKYHPYKYTTYIGVPFLSWLACDQMLIAAKHRMCTFNALNQAIFPTYRGLESRRERQGRSEGTELTTRFFRFLATFFHNRKTHCSITRYLYSPVFIRCIIELHMTTKDSMNFLSPSFDSFYTFGMCANSAHFTAS